tara:strand:- start:2321 stop:4192 length:1872 start_codon:yes stop_codon:yes gene_type:complete
MSTLLKAHLRKTEDPLEMFEILLREYYPTILKATGTDFIDAILADKSSKKFLGGFKDGTLKAFQKLKKVSEESLTRIKDFDKDEMEGEFPDFMNRDVLMGEPDVMVSGKPKKRGKKRTQRRTGEEEVRMERGKPIGASTIKDPKIPKPTGPKWLSQLKRKETQKEFQARLKRWERNKAKTLEPRGEFRSGETGYEEPYRLNNLIKFKNLLEAEKNWDGSKWGSLTKITNGLDKLIKKEEDRLKGAKKKKTGQFQGEGQASKEKVVSVDSNLKKDKKILEKLSTKLKNVNIFDLEGQLAFDKDIEDPILELIPNAKALKKLEDASLPSYYLKPLNIGSMNKNETESVNELVREEFSKELDRDYGDLSRPSKDDPFPLESLYVLPRRGEDPERAYISERQKDFEPFKEMWLERNGDELFTNSERVAFLSSKEDKDLNELKKEIHEVLTKEQGYMEMSGKKVKKTLLDALIYTKEQKTGVVIERIQEDRNSLNNEFNALKTALNEGTLRDLLELSRINFMIEPISKDKKTKITLDDWQSLQNDVKNYLDNEFKEVRITEKNQAPIEDDFMIKQASVKFIEPIDGFDKNEFTTNFENTFSGRVNIKSKITSGKSKSKEQIMEERRSE